jgi:hypothetical protein
MSHEQMWAWLFQIGTAGLGWAPAVVTGCDMSDILLAWEGKFAIEKEMFGQPNPKPMTPEIFDAMLSKKANLI